MRFRQVRPRCGRGKETYFPTGLFGCDLSLLFRHRPHKRQLLPGIHPRAQRSPGGGVWREERLYKPGRGGAKTRIRGSRGTQGSDLPASALRTRDSDVRRALRIGCSEDHSPRALASARPPLHPAPRYSGRWGLADTSERADSVLEDELAARPDLPLGSNRLPAPWWGRGGRPQGGFQTGGGARWEGPESRLSITSHTPRPPPHWRGPSGMGPCVPRLWEAAIWQTAGRRVSRGRG